MDIGDIYAVEIPSTNGHEQAGIRPAIIMQSSDFEKQLPTVIIIPLTSQQAAQVFPGTFVIHPDKYNGLSLVSVALVFQMRAIDKKRLKKKIGRLSDPQLTEIYQKIKALMKL